LNFNKGISKILEFPNSSLPDHVAIIMDGNGRWAKKRLLNRVKGHEKGVNAIRGVVETSRELGIKYLTLYAFSTENWGRPKAEVSALMYLLESFLEKELANFLENGIRLHAFGELDRLPEKARNKLDAVMDTTSGNDTLHLNLCLSYGGRSDLVQAIKNIASMVEQGKISINDVNENLVSSCLYSSGIPDPDILIRTSGEMRLSNFMMWQLSYSELFFTDTLWPDFSPNEFVEILNSYVTRDRRFGKV